MPEMSGFVFDCDGTLLDTERVWSAAEESTVRRYDAPWSDDLQRQFVGRTPRQTANIIADHAEVPDHERDGVYRVLTRTFDDLVGRGRATPTTGAETLLRELRHRGVPVGLVSNSPRAQVTGALERARLHLWLDCVLCADDPGLKPKPDPALYEAACGELGLDARRSVAFEDAQTGIDAALDAEMYTVAVPAPISTSGAHRRVEALWPLDVDELLHAASLPRPVNGR